MCFCFFSDATKFTGVLLPAMLGEDEKTCFSPFGTKIAHTLVGGTPVLRKVATMPGKEQRLTKEGGKNYEQTHYYSRCCCLVFGWH